MGIRIWGLERTIIGFGTFWKKGGSIRGNSEKAKRKGKSRGRQWDLGGLWAYMGIGVGHSSFAFEHFSPCILFFFSLVSLYRYGVVLILPKGV
jgi:hypothetical protein